MPGDVAGNNQRNLDVTFEGVTLAKVKPPIRFWSPSSEGKLPSTRIETPGSCVPGVASFSISAVKVASTTPPAVVIVNVDPTRQGPKLLFVVLPSGIAVADEL